MQNKSALQDIESPHYTPLTVSQLNGQVKDLLEDEFGSTWVTGEISNLTRPPSGHIYFTLKDDRAQIRCAFFRTYFYALSFVPEEGMKVEVKAQVSLYEARGDYQLIIEYMEKAGDGELKRAFEKLKQKLATQGLFNHEHKKPLPIIPKQIGVITSPTGAAIRDVLTVLKRRFPSIPVMVYPTQVQGKEAKSQIVSAIELANRRQECDVLLLTRGGGSLEDLSPFNEEAVANAIYKSEIPIVSAVGHEVDITISDLVADKRAATPSAGAEELSPDQVQWQQALDKLTETIQAYWQNHLRHWRQSLSILQHRLIHPQHKLSQYARQLSDLKNRLIQVIRFQQKTSTDTVNYLSQRLKLSSPKHQLGRHHDQCQQLSAQLKRAMHEKLAQANQRLQRTAEQLNIISPLATLERGYAIARDDKQHIINSIKKVKSGQPINVRLQDGDIEASVISIKPRQH